jgi:16S rRNA U1498 N3-methylase RsmE
VVERPGGTVKMAVMRGSHTYNTAEMSRLIDATVEEAKELGVETLTPDQLERMKASWIKRS